MALSIPLTAPLTAPGTRTCLSIHSLFGRTTFTRHCRLPHFSASPWLLKNRSSLWGPFIALPQSLTSPHPYPGTYLWGAPDRTRSQERERERERSDGEAGGEDHSCGLCLHARAERVEVEVRCDGPCPAEEAPGGECHPQRKAERLAAKVERASEEWRVGASGVLHGLRRVEGSPAYSP